MAVLDIVVLLIVGGFAGRGLFKGFVKEVLSLCAVVAGIFGVYFFHAGVTRFAAPWLGTEYVAALLAFVLVFGLLYVSVKLIASTVSSQMRNVGLGTFDRILGAGFGAVKGMLILVVAFVGFTIVYDALFGELSPRPEWLRLTRSYPLLNVGGEAMSNWVAENSRDGGIISLGEDKAEPDGSADSINKAEP